MITRRDHLKLGLAAGAALTMPAGLAWAVTRPGSVLTRVIPSSGETLPVVGLGSSATFSQLARGEDVSALREVMAAMLQHGGTVFDTAPSYGESERVAGEIVRGLPAAEKVFWATKVNVAARGGGTADPVAAKSQVEASFQRFGGSPIDLIQVHNLGDVPTQLGLLKELKAEERVRHIGVTTTSAPQYPQLIEVMRSEPLDFIGIDYAIDNRVMEQAVLPLAADRGIAVMVYLPFGRTRLWQRVRGQALPAWAVDCDAHSWAQFFLKFVIAHPAVTVVTPATSQAKHMVDNMGAAYGRLPDADLRQRMAAFVDSLPGG